MKPMSSMIPASSSLLVRRGELPLLCQCCKGPEKVAQKTTGKAAVSTRVSSITSSRAGCVRCVVDRRYGMVTTVCSKDTAGFCVPHERMSAFFRVW